MRLLARILTPQSVLPVEQARIRGLQRRLMQDGRRGDEAVGRVGMQLEGG